MSIWDAILGIFGGGKKPPRGLYVWGSFGACLLAFVVEPLLIRQRHSQAVRTLRRQTAAEKLEMENP